MVIWKVNIVEYCLCVTLFLMNFANMRLCYELLDNELGMSFKFGVEF